MVKRQHSGHTGLSNDSELADDMDDGMGMGMGMGMGERFQERSLSETVVKRKSSFLKNGKSIWGRLWKRRKYGRMHRTNSEGGLGASRDAAVFGRSSRGLGEARRSGVLHHRRSWLSDTLFGSKRDR